MSVFTIKISILKIFYVTTKDFNGFKVRLNAVVWPITTHRIAISGKITIRSDVVVTTGSMLKIKIGRSDKSPRFLASILYSLASQAYCSDKNTNANNCDISEITQTGIFTKSCLADVTQSTEDITIVVGIVGIIAGVICLLGTLFGFWSFCTRNKYWNRN